MTHNSFAYAGKEGENYNMAVHSEMRNHRLGEVWRQNMMFVKVKLHSSITQMRIVETLEGKELVCRTLCRTVPSQKMPVEIDRHLWHHSMSFLGIQTCKLYACKQILLAVCTQLTYWKLRTGQYDWFRQIAEHEREC